MGISLLEAADRVGMTKAGIKKAIVKGKLSAKKNDHGEWDIDPAELFRVYPPKSTEPTNQSEPVSSGMQQVSGNDNRVLEAENKLLREQVDLLKDQLGKAEENHSKTMKLLEDQIVSVRLLADQREEKPEKKGLFARLFG